MIVLNFIVRAVITLLRFTIKLLTFAITIALALFKFVIGITLVILTLGAFASSTSKY